MKTERESASYKGLFKFFSEKLKGLPSVEFEIGYEEMRDEIGLEKDKYITGGKFQPAHFKFHCLKPNLKKLEKKGKIKIKFSERKEEGKKLLIFKLERLEGYEEEKRSENNILKTPPKKTTEPKVEKKAEIVEEEEIKTIDNKGGATWEELSGLSNVVNLYPFAWLKENEARKLMYGLHKVCEKDSRFFYKELLKALKMKEIPDEILPYIRNLDEEYGIIPSEFGLENRVVVLVLRGENEAAIFNILVKNNSGEYEKILCETAFNDNCSVIAVTGEVLRFYRRLVGRLEKRVQWPQEPGEVTFQEIVKILEEKEE